MSPWNKKLNNAPGQNQNRIELPESVEALDEIKYKIADEIGVNVPKKGKARDWRMVPSYYCGAVGGKVVKRMMQYAEKMASEGHDVLVKEENEGNVPHDTRPPTPYEGPTEPIGPVHGTPDQVH